MGQLHTYMFDTNVFNRILDGVICLDQVKGCVAYATHIQRDELDNTKDERRRAALAFIFADVVTSTPTSSFVLDVSRLDEARLGGGRLVPTASGVYGISNYGEAQYSAEDDLYSALKQRLDQVNGNKTNNIQDALIAETAIKEGHILVTDDADLADVTRSFGGTCISVLELVSKTSTDTAT